LARHRLITQKQTKLKSAIILGIFVSQTYKLALISFITNQLLKKISHTDTQETTPPCSGYFLQLSSGSTDIQRT